MSEDPWSGLAIGSIDARRVSPDGRHDFFWVFAGNGEPGLLLRLQDETAEIQPLPRMRNLDLSYRGIAGRRSLILLLKDSEQRELFAELCRDIVRAGEAATENGDALNRSIRRTMRWHHLLRGGRSEQLSLEEQRGLLGELNFLERLIGLLGHRAAIEAWRGPSGASKDFELGDCLVEVKARRGAARPYVQISSEDQLTDVEDCRLFLVVTPIDAVVKPAGKTLTDYVSDLDRQFSMEDADACMLWEQALAETGFDFAHDYSERRWMIGRNLEFEVVDGFPRITGPLPNGVSGVRYSIGLDACAPFAIAENILEQLIADGNL
jgi:hypothetical protein